MALPCSGETRLGPCSSKSLARSFCRNLRAQALLNAPDTATKKGLRDRAMLAILLGCGLRRSEVAALTLGHIQHRDNRWCIVDLVGKHGRVRTIAMPTWVKVAIDVWTSAAGFSDGPVLRPVNRGDQVQSAGLSEKVVWQLLQQYADAVGVAGIAPHDLAWFPQLRKCTSTRIATGACRRRFRAGSPRHPRNLGSVRSSG